MTNLTLESLNQLDRAEFVVTLGGLFEHSPWIAEQAWSHRPFSNRDDLLKKLFSVVRSSSLNCHLALIRAHPDLAGRLAQQKMLTPASELEQTSAGLNRLTPDQQAAFARFNEDYLKKFGFPFVICARLNDVQSIFQAFERRLNLTPAEEITTALHEIEKIATLRLAQLWPE